MTNTNNARGRGGRMRKPAIRVVRSSTCARHVRIQRLQPLGASSIVSVKLADNDCIIYECEGIENAAGAVVLWTTGYGNLFGKFDEQIAEMRAILAEAA